MFLRVCFGSTLRRKTPINNISNPMKFLSLRGITDDEVDLTINFISSFSNTNEMG